MVPLTPGTTIDILARLYADKLGKLLGQQIVVMNRPGAGGIVGAESVATAAPDGYTLLFGNSGHSILGLLNKNLVFDPIKDFAGVAMIGAAPAIVVVPSALDENCPAISCCCIAADSATARGCCGRSSNAIVASLPTDREGVAVAEFDLDEIAKARASWGIFRDRRPDLYGPIGQHG